MLLVPGAAGLGPGALGAQEVTGRVVSAGNGGPVVLAIVELLGPDGVRVGAALTGEQGLFSVPVEGFVGPVRLEVRAMNHRAQALDSLHVDGRESLRLSDIVLEVAPLVLDTLQIEGPTGRLRGRERVRRRQLLGRGTFLSGAALEGANPGSLVRHVADAAGLMLTAAGRGLPGLRSPRSPGDCIRIQVNHWPLSRTGYRHLDHIPLEAIAAVEIHETPWDVPVEQIIGLDAIAQGCGLVNVWLWNSW